MVMLRARYGAKDNSHALLWQSDPSVKLPTALLGLTDRPQGYELPGEQWWPSVGCAPLNGYWALWWTRPDTDALRGGMVRSEVALWPLADIGAQPDLFGVLEELSGTPVAAASPERLRSLAEAVVNPGESTPVVLSLEDWPGLLAGLWPRLSPSLRRQFSARVALTPPQSGQSVAEPWLYAAPSGRRLHWPGRQRIDTALLPTSRVALWLAGQADALLEEVLTTYGADWPDLAALRRVARVTDGLQRLRDQATALDAFQIIALLRTLVTLPETDSTRTLQQEAITGIAAQLPTADYPALKSLANIHLSADAARPLVQRVMEWVESRMLTLALPDAGDLLSRAVKNELEAWWRQGVCEALRRAFTQPFGAWPTQTLRWLGLPPAHPALDQLLPTDAATEASLLAAAEQTILPDEELQACQAQCGQRNWSRLHAHILHQAVEPKQQLTQQLAFPGDVTPGLAYLVEALPGDIVLAQTLATPEAPLLPLAAQRTCQQPDLLDNLNPHQVPWRSLWAAHIEAGGAHWPPGADQTQLAQQLMDAVLDGAKADGLVLALADEMGDVALAHPQRAQLWATLGHGAAERLLAACARRFIQLLESINEPEPEQPLSRAILAHTESGPRSALLIATVANWSVCSDEQMVCRWLEQPVYAGWTQAMAEKLGQVAARRHWGRLAAAMYSQCRRENRVLAHGVQACVGLLLPWDQGIFAWLYAPSPSRSVDHNILAQRVAQLGAELAAHEALSYWERVGGRRRDISDRATPSEQWLQIARRAQQGANSGGLRALVESLHDSFPHNTRVQELLQIVKISR
ncbi:GAP1-N1 domain-containing protein [Rivihabitans pingtungensis]|uniref:GAP1-N1 domain-containing protein n=1 Tax=Rivihabitans pingtungensis TaxID=1054498 RepID=UPI0023571DA7|nr:hypothetical protein [Rivihabitans pingtungensis]MCK6436526.1 hypothetical protein [Rivihabitans pingtungensis]